MVWPASNGPARRFRSPGGARSASLRPGLASSVPRPRLHEVGASSCAAARRRASTVRMTCGRALESAKGLTQTSQISFQGPTWRVGVTVFHVALPSVAANSKVMSRMRAVHSAMHSSQVPGHVTAILTAHMHDAGADPRLARFLRTPPRNCCHCHGPLFSFVRCGRPCGTQRGRRGAQVTPSSRDHHIRAHG